LQQLCRSIYIDVGDDSDISVTLVIGVIRQYVDVIANQSGSAREAGQSLVSDVSLLFSALMLQCCVCRLSLCTVAKRCVIEQKLTS